MIYVNIKNIVNIIFVVLVLVLVLVLGFAKPFLRIIFSSVDLMRGGAQEIALEQVK